MSDVSEAWSAVQATRELLSAYDDFYEQVGLVAVRLAERQDDTALVLLELMKDFQARTGEFVTTEENA